MRTRLHARTSELRLNEQGYRPFRWAALFTLLVLVGLGDQALGGDPLRYRPGLRNAAGDKKLETKQLDQLARSLQAKTGFAELRFDEDGFLSIGDRTHFSGGSATAREVLIATTEIKHAIDLESHARSSSISFARIGDQISFESRATGAKIDRSAIQLDFNDFSQIRGDREAIEAFDIGFVLLHELGHAVLGLHDSYDNSPGDCEGMVNRIRRELQLPERQTYIAQVYTAAHFPAASRVKRAELIFKHVSGAPKARALFRLDWDALRVGPILDKDILSAGKSRPLKSLSATAAGQ
jgi:hypothetical protein